MNSKNYKRWQLALRLVLIVVLGTGTVSLLYAQQDKQPATEESQEEVLQQLLKDPMPRPLPGPEQVLDEATVPPVESVDPKAKMPLRVRELDWVINRLGRLSKDATGSPLFVYEADGKALTEPPLILLPCTKLEQMENWAKQKPDAKFAVTGEITVYRGKGYLLLRKVMLQRNMGQF